VPIEYLIANPSKLNQQWIQTEGFMLFEDESCVIYSNISLPSYDLRISGILVDLENIRPTWPFEPEEAGAKLVAVHIRAKVQLRPYSKENIMLTNAEILGILARRSDIVKVNDSKESISTIDETQ